MKFLIIEVPRSRCYGSTSTLKAYCATLWWRWLFLFWFSILMEHRNRSTRRKTCPTAALSTTNPSCTDPGWNPGLRGERPATNRLSHGTGYIRRYRIVDCLTIYIIRAEAKERSAITYYFEFSSSVIIKPRTLSTKHTCHWGNKMNTQGLFYVTAVANHFPSARLSYETSTCKEICDC
jgi:hypothetical protein